MKWANLRTDGFAIFLKKSDLVESLSCIVSCVAQSDFNTFMCCEQFVPFGCFFRRQFDN